MSLFRNFSCLFIGLFVNLLQAKSLEVQIETPYALVMDVKTGKVLYEKRAREKVHPASTTKIATALYILKTAPNIMDEVATCSEEALRIVTEATKKEKVELLPDYILETDGTMIYLRKKEKMSVRDLLYGAMLRSGNDAANVLAEYVSGDIPTFVSRMNQMVTEL